MNPSAHLHCIQLWHCGIVATLQLLVGHESSQCEPEVIFITSSNSKTCTL